MYPTYALAEFVVWTLLCFLAAARGWYPTVQDRDNRMINPPGGGSLIFFSELTIAVLLKCGVGDLIEAACPKPHLSLAACE